LGLRSSFNLVAERYPLDTGLIDDLRARGFEVGIHGLRHDGRELRSRRAFAATATRLNEHIDRLDAAGFRSPLTHRNPEWMQALEVDYDASFFDTDPFEPMPGGTMSTWPFFLGHFVELPYTLAQDSTLFDVLGERGPRLWLEKARYLARWHGMALLNTHPDYLRLPGRWDAYAELLDQVRDLGWWNALPRDVAAWWRLRGAAGGVETLEGGREALLVRGEHGEVEVLPPATASTASWNRDRPLAR
jgi:peptidoglycan/xylan/chitin deacetylase (PgdA/CDA1 family)